MVDHRIAGLCGAFPNRAVPKLLKGALGESENAPQQSILTFFMTDAQLHDLLHMTQGHAYLLLTSLFSQTTGGFGFKGANASRCLHQVWAHVQPLQTLQ